ncbi:AMP-binding protein [Gordonia mangrovi]|nr:AMP-binding protein [Gordonia mangrovi]UVF79530.1 AMP-binding protein [Gordonia mangrovi]
MTEPTTTLARWRATADRCADAIAVCSPDGSVTYGEARDHADERGRALAAAVDEPGRPVAVDVESDVDSVLAVLSVLCSGHPVILLDPLLPDERRDHILALSGARRFYPAAIAALPASATPVPEPGPLDPSILIFTSGSTGKPKGLIHSQRGWVNQADDGHEFLGLGPGDRMAVLLPIGFGAGVDCLVMGLLNGATLLLWDVRRRTTAGLRDWLDAEAATTAHCTPSLLRSWLGDLDADAALPALRLLSTCGEPVRGADVTRLRRTLMPSGVFCSWSGSSEMGNLAFHLVGPDRDVPDGVLAVGVPARDKHVRIVDDDGNDVADGQAGEIVVESGHLALGYHNDPELTAARFEALGNGRTRLRTGDLGRLDDTGMLHLMGRRDDAIKVRGYLVEPAEVETALRAMSWTVDAVVSANAARTQLVAHVAVAPDTWTPSPAEVRTALATTLAPWMIPRDVVIMTDLPRNERGKVDRAALPQPERRRDPEPVRGPTESALMHLWCDVLGVPDVGRDEDFISLGGDSLAAATMLAELRERWLVDISTAEFVAAPTIATLAALLDDAHRERVASGTISTVRAGSGQPVFLIAGAGSPAASLVPLARRIDGDRKVFGLQAHGLEQRGRADRSIRSAARRAVRDITAAVDNGPYLIGGYSFGAFVAVEAATILRDRGEDCAQVVLIDPVFEPELLHRVCGDVPQGNRAHKATRRLLGDRSAALPDRGVTEHADDGPTSQPAWQRWWNAVAMRGLVATAGLVRLPTTLQWTVFWDLGRQLIRRHRPTPYAGPVTVIRATTNPDDPGVWKRLATGDLTVATVPGDHHSMMREPLVAETAAAVDRAISADAGARCALRAVTS